MRHTRFRLAFAATNVVLVVGVVLATCASAYAQAPSPATDRYGTKVERIAVDGAQQQPATNAQAEQSALPDRARPCSGR